MIRAGIVGGAGYTGGELCRLLVHHPEATIAWIHSESNAGRPVSAVHEGLVGDTDLVFAHTLDFDVIDVLFLCFGHGKSRKFLAENAVPERVKIIDLAQDFRLYEPGTEFSYGLPELYRWGISQSRCVANPGCFATAITLALLPLAKAGRLHSPIVVNAVTGSTGAGVSPGATTHFSWRQNNFSTYKVFGHQHLAEIRETLGNLQQGFAADIDFIPYRGDFARGIFATALVRTDIGQDELTALYDDYYARAPFTHSVHRSPDLKEVVNTNKCLVHAAAYEGGRVLITSCIDNLLKGASGQAVQNMNLLFGIDETAGLNLKAVAF